MTLLHPTEKIPFHQPNLEDPASLEQTRYELLRTSEEIREGTTQPSPEQLHEIAAVALRILSPDTQLPGFERFHTASQLLANLPNDYQPPELQNILHESAQEAFPHNAAEELIAAEYAIRRTSPEQPFVSALEQAHAKMGQSTEEVIRTSQAVITKQREQKLLEERRARRYAALTEATDTFED
jgi:hypothetical protein